MDAQAVPAVAAVPFLDLGRTHAPLKERILGDVADLIDTGAFTNGPPVAAFEDAFAEFCGREHCVGVASGLDALRLALVAAGLEPGDEVIVPAATFVATLEAVTQAGGVPVVADASEADYGLAAPAADAAVTARTRFVMPVHLYGQLADPIALRSVAERHGLAIVEDACQAHGAERDGFRAGGLGLAAAFSFYPGKNLGAFGDAGALVCDDAGLAAAVRALREHGQAQKYRHVREGYTSRLDTIQAIVLAHKLPLLAAWNDERRAAAAAYDAALAGVGDLVLPPVPRGSDPVWHLYVVRSARRDDLASFLRARGIATGLHYPEPPHLSAAYAYLGHGRGSFPVAERLADEALSLPMFPGIRSEEVAAVADAVAAFFRRG